MSTATSAEREAFGGLVERVTYHNAENGFCVLRVKARGQRDLVTVVGAAASDQRRRVHPGLGHLDQRPHARAAIQGRLPQDRTADHAGGHRALSRLRHDQGHRPGLCQEAGAGVRCGRVRRHRAGARTPPGGRRHRAQAGAAHPHRLGRAEGDPRDHAVPARPWRRHVTRGADLQDLRCRCRPGHLGEPLPPGPRHQGHRLQECRSDRDAARDREDGDDPRPGRDQLRSGRSHGRGPLRPADGRAARARRRVAGDHRRGGGCSDRAGAGRWCRHRRHGPGPPLPVPGRALPRRAGHRRAAAPAEPRKPALARGRSRTRPFLGSSREPAWSWLPASGKRCGWHCAPRSW